MSKHVYKSYFITVGFTHTSLALIFLFNFNLIYNRNCWSSDPHKPILLINNTFILFHYCKLHIQIQQENIPVRGKPPAFQLYRARLGPCTAIGCTVRSKLNGRVPVWWGPMHHRFWSHWTPNPSVNRQTDRDTRLNTLPFFRNFIGGLWKVYINTSVLIFVLTQKVCNGGLFRRNVSLWRL